MNEKHIDKYFDGHLEKPLREMTPKEKLDYIWKQMYLKKYINDRVKKTDKQNK